MITFSNPRLRAEIADWPYGGSKRGSCVFKVEHDKRGYRVARTTTGKPKHTTYSDGKACVVDGSDGKTYVLLHRLTRGECVRVVMSDMMHDASAALGLQSAYVRDGELLATLKGLIEAAK